METRPETRSFLSAAALLGFAGIISVVMADLCGAREARKAGFLFTETISGSVSSLSSNH